jgi:hypothetical protein
MSLSAGGVLTVQNQVSVPVLNGGPSNAGHLNGWGNTGGICFRFVPDAVNTLRYRVNETVEEDICTKINAADLNLVGGTGGPTGISMNLLDNAGSLYAIYVDAVSDERIKDNIRNTELDATALVMSVPVRAFDIKAEVAAWQRSVGNTPEQREQMMREAMPVHVPLGFVAQELREAVPEAVRTPPSNYRQPEGSPLPDDLLTFSAEALVPYLWRAVQQQQELITSLTSRLAALEQGGSK